MKMSRKSDAEYLKQYPNNICQPCKTWDDVISYGILRKELDLYVCNKCYRPIRAEPELTEDYMMKVRRVFLLNIRGYDE